MEISPITISANPVEAMAKAILEAEEPWQIIRDLSPQDYFQLIKTMDETNGLTLLESGSPEQWQYLLDLEIWHQDHLDLAQSSRWLDLFGQANPGQLIRWLFGEGESLASYYFSRLIEVIVIKEPNEARDLPEGFFSLDGQLYLRAKDGALREGLVHILRNMAVEDYEKYQDLLLELESVIPAESEEEMYRMRNVRLAEHGFLPYEEALAIYAPLEPTVLKTPERLAPSADQGNPEDLGPVPILPLAQTRTHNQFLSVAMEVQDPLLSGRLRVEFAGLANQILSAERQTTFEKEVLIGACTRAARLVNLTVEKICGRDLSAVEGLLRRNSLVTLFRIGFGMVLKLKWEAERWRKTSWFHRQGLGPSFWGETQGKMLSGLLEKRPRFYAGSKEKEDYRDFEKLSDLRDGLEVLQGLMVLDGLLEKMTAAYPLPETLLHSPETTCPSLLFNFWARLRLHRDPAFTGITLEEAKQFLSGLQGLYPEPPFIPDGFQPIFIRDLMSQIPKADPLAAALLEQTLGKIWQDFQKEYSQVSPADLDSRYSRFLTIAPII